MAKVYTDKDADLGVFKGKKHSPFSASDRRVTPTR